MSRRWKSGQITDLSGIRFRVVQGAKSPEDLRLEWWTGNRWTPVHMAVAFYLIDFFTENEGYLNPYRPNWRRSGEAYFLDECHAAARDGWQAPARRIVEQRRRKEAA